MKKVITLLYSVILLSGCDSHFYYNEANLLIGDVKNVLIENGMCEKEQGCLNKELVKFEAGGWSLGPWSGGGVYINVYQVKSEKIVQDLHASFINRHLDMQKVPVYLNVYSTEHGKNKIKIAEYSFQ